MERLARGAIEAHPLHSLIGPTWLRGVRDPAVFSRIFDFHWIAPMRRDRKFNSTRRGLRTDWRQAMSRSGADDARGY